MQHFGEGGERVRVVESESGREGDNVRHFKFVSHLGHKGTIQPLNLPPADLKNLNHLAWSERFRHYTKKTSPVTLTSLVIYGHVPANF